jgi:metal-responsive CopG/Arc/MetJ family transcriptional regulator
MNRVKISVTVDPTLLEVVDDFIERNDGADRSKVIDQALSQWSARRQDDAMTAQYSASEEPTSERVGWRSTRRAAATRRLRRA